MSGLTNFLSIATVFIALAVFFQVYTISLAILEKSDTRSQKQAKTENNEILYRGALTQDQVFVLPGRVVISSPDDSFEITSEELIGNFKLFSYFKKKSRISHRPLFFIHPSASHNYYLVAKTANQAGIRFASKVRFQGECQHIDSTSVVGKKMYRTCLNSLKEIARQE